MHFSINGGAHGATAGRIFFGNKLNYHLDSELLGTPFCSAMTMYSADFTDEPKYISEDGQYNIEEKPRHHYDTVWVAMLTNFQIMTAENWPSVLYDTMKASGGTGILGALYVILSLVINNYFILALFLAVLIDEFTAEIKEESSGPAMVSAFEVDAVLSSEDEGWSDDEGAADLQRVV